MDRKHVGVPILVAVVLGVVLFMVLTSCWGSVPAGHVGIATTFGAVSDDVLDPGLHFVPFWTKVHPMSVQSMEDKETAEVPTKEGLSVNLDCSLIYSLK